MIAHCSVSSCVLARHISRTRTVAQVMSLSSHPHVHVHVSVSLRFALFFYFTNFLPHSFRFFLHLKFVDNLRIPPKESMDLSDEFFLSTGYMSPTPTTSRRPQSSSYTELLGSPPLFSNEVSSADADYDDACTRGYASRSSPSTCPSLSTRTLFCRSVVVVSVRQNGANRWRQNGSDPLSKETRKHRLELCSTNRKSKFLQNAKQELVNTNFKQLEPKKSNDSFQGQLLQQRVELREAHQRSLTEMEELNKQQSSTFDTVCKTKISRGPGHYFGIYWQDTGFCKMK